MAARFVEFPMAMAEKWVATFDGRSVGVQRAFDPDAAIHTLRIEWDFVASVFEVVWQGGELEHSELAQAWHTVWKEMGKTLGSAPHVFDVEEDWWRNLNQLDDPPFTTSQASAATAYQLDTYPPLDQPDADAGPTG